jgi:hypothetical protein
MNANKIPGGDLLSEIQTKWKYDQGEYRKCKYHHTKAKPLSREQKQDAPFSPPEKNNAVEHVSSL